MDGEVSATLLAIVEILSLNFEYGGAKTRLQATCCICFSNLIHDYLNLRKFTASWLRGNALVYGAEGLRVKSYAGQTRHSVANGSSPLQHFFKKTCAARETMTWR